MKESIKIIVFVIVIISFILIAFFERRKINERIKNAEYVEGKITGRGSSARSEHYVAYRFIVLGKEYTGSIDDDFCKKCNSECCNVDSKVIVRYDRNNPNNNDLVYELPSGAVLVN